MNRFETNRRRNRSTKALFAAAAGTAIAGVLPSAAQAVPTTVTWANTGTAWTTGANWVGGVAPANDSTSNIALFDSVTPSAQPVLPNSGAPAPTKRIAGLVLSTSTGGWNFADSPSNYNALVFGAYGIDSQNTSGTNTINTDYVAVNDAAQSWNVAAGGTLVVQSMISQDGFSHANSKTLTKTGGGRLDLSQNSGLISNWSGNFNINGGIVSANYAAALGSFTAGARTITIASGATLNAGGTSVLSDGHVNLSFINEGTITNSGPYYNQLGNLTLRGGILTSTGSNPANTGTWRMGGTITVDGTTVSTISSHTLNSEAHGVSLVTAGTTFNVADNAVGTDLLVTASLTNHITGASPAPGHLIKTGAGTMRLAGTNHYTGTTTVNNGTLQVDGSISGSATTVTAGTLSGIGTAGSVVIGNASGSADAILAPGNSIGTISTGNLTFASDGKYAVEVDGAVNGSSDKTVVTGAVNLGNAVLDLSFTNAVTGVKKYFIIVNDDTDAVTGTFLGLSDGATVSGMTINYTGDSGTGNLTGGNDVVLSVVPEPSSLMGLLGAGALMAIRRRKRS